MEFCFVQLNGDICLVISVPATNLSSWLCGVALKWRTLVRFTFWGGKQRQTGAVEAAGFTACLGHQSPSVLKPKDVSVAFAGRDYSFRFGNAAIRVPSVRSHGSDAEGDTEPSLPAQRSNSVQRSSIEHQTESRLHAA